MRRLFYIIMVGCFTLITASSLNGCRSGYGCPAEEAYEKSKEKPLSNKRGKSKLFKDHR